MPPSAKTAAVRHAADEDLLRSVRMLAAKYANVDPARSGWRRVLAAERECSFTPFLLAGRSNGELSDAEHARLEHHLDSCLPCQAAELRFARAERVFDGVLQGELALDAIAAGRRSEQATTQFEQVAAVEERVLDGRQPVVSPAPPPPDSRSSGRRKTALAAGALVAAGLVARRRALRGSA